MSIVIGIDVGISTTKIVGIRDGEIFAPIRIRATDPVTSLYGAFGKYLHENKIELNDVEHVMLTGVGSAYINKPVYGLPTDKAEEFIADGLGARYESGRDRIIVVSMGTGTSLVRCDGDKIEHIGGIGIGGGTLQGLSRLLLKTDDIRTVSEIAKSGDVSNINLLIGDISARPLPGLPMDAVASLFGNARSDASREDIALGLIWTVLQSVGQSAVLASIGSNIKEYVMIGNLTLLPQCRDVFPAIERLYGVKLIISKYSEFCTAIGAALCYFDDRYETLKL
ncbi:MAG: type II pantothenate kinase [Prevotellaceae bacterium]|nr:type II pantothenate kinase [Prevotellaceae bacterium]